MKYSSDRHKTKRLSEEEIGRLEAALVTPRKAGFKGRAYSDRRNYAILRLLFLTGMRCCEVARLRTEDISRRRVHEQDVLVLDLQGKGGRPREAVLLNGQCGFLERYLKQRPGPKTGPVFHAATKGKKAIPGVAITALAVNHFCKRFGARIGVANLHPHRLRHSRASLMAENGTGLFQLQRWFGWSQPSTAARYVNVSLGALVDMAMEA